MVKYTYPIVLIAEDEGKWSVLFPDLPGCQTWGNNLDEARLQAKDALEGHLAAMLDDNDPIPEPTMDSDKFMEKVRALYVKLDIPQRTGCALEMVEVEI